MDGQKEGQDIGVKVFKVVIGFASAIVSLVVMSAIAVVVIIKFGELFQP